MGEFMEVWSVGQPTLVALDGDRVSLGRSPDNDIAVEDDSISWLHAAMTRYASGWAIRDLRSSNGTFVNTERIFGERRLHNNDEVVLGRCRLRFRAAVMAPARTAEASDSPSVTARERDVLTAICRPLRGGQGFGPPTTIAGIAEELGISQAAVRNHLAKLYAKFDVTERGPQRLAQLANEAIRRRAVSLS